MSYEALPSNLTHEELLAKGYYQSEDDPSLYFKDTDDPQTWLMYNINAGKE